MANTDKILPGYPQSVGAKIQGVADHYGPLSYSSTTGDVYTIAGTWNLGGFDKVNAGYSLDDIYTVTTTYPAGANAGVGVTSIKFIWNFATTGSVASVTSSGGTGMTAGTYALSFSGGGGSGAAGTVVITGATTVGTITITAPGSGYTSAPTVSAATGGTPPTLTAVLSVAGAQVATGANLNGSAVRIEALMY